MAAALDNENMAVVDLWPYVIALHGNMCECACDIEGGKRFGAFLYVEALRHHRRDQPIENIQLQTERALGGAGDLRFQFTEFGGAKAYLPCECLPVNEYAIERRTHQAFAVLRGHFHKIAKHIVVLDFENANTGVLGVARLQRRYDAARFIAQRAGLVEELVIALADEAAVALESRQLGGECRRQFGR